MYALGVTKIHMCVYTPPLFKLEVYSLSLSTEVICIILSSGPCWFFFFPSIFSYSFKTSSLFIPFCMLSFLLLLNQSFCFIFQKKPLSINFQFYHVLFICVITFLVPKTLWYYRDFFMRSNFYVYSHFQSPVTTFLFNLSSVNLSYLVLYDLWYRLLLKCLEILGNSYRLPFIIQSYIITVKEKE